MKRRALVLGVLGALVAALVGVGPGVGTGVAPAFAAPSVPSTQATQTSSLRWTSCRSGAQCSALAVPLDDTVAGGPTITLALIRYPATDQAQRIGSLLVNPGGPGASGVDFLASYIDELPAKLRARFDVVSFDPRGVGASAGVDCGVNLDPLWSLEWVPTTDAQRAQLDAGIRSFVAACQQANGAVLPYLTTQRTARDLDRIRIALGDSKLTYLGYSYGTYLGAWYAQQFPDKVRALVLDGPVDPALDAATEQVQQAVGFEHGLDLFLADCAKRSSCAFHRSGKPQAAYDRLRARVASTPLRVDGVGAARALNGTLFDIGVASILYSGRVAWPSLASALNQADRGDGAALLASADDYTGRSPNGTYDNAQEAFFAIGCADGPPFGGAAGLAVITQQAAKEAPRLGPSIVNGSLPCAYWPVTPPPPMALHATGEPPVLVLGTRDDPATPLVWAKGLAGQLDSAVLVTAGGSQHTAFPAGTACVDDTVVNYLLALTVPARTRRC